MANDPQRTHTCGKPKIMGCQLTKGGETVSIGHLLYTRYCTRVFALTVLPPPAVNEETDAERGGEFQKAHG